ITIPGAGNLTYSGRTFGGWNTQANGDGTNYNAGAAYTVNGDITFYAKWNIDAIETGVVFNVSTTLEFTSALSSIQSSSQDNFTINVTSDMSLAPQSLTSTSYANKTITIKGNNSSRKINLSSNGSLFTAGANVELVLEDILLEGRNDNNASLVKVNSTGKLVLNNGGKVTGNTFNTSVTNTGGAGIFIDEGTLEIAGGEVSGNKVNGTIRGNVFGGGIYAVNNSNILMSNGAIRNNICTNVASGDGVNANGGGISIRNNSYFEMINGIIENNNLFSQSTSMAGSVHGGGVFIYESSSFILLNGKIRNNIISAISSNNYGGAVGGGVLVDGSFIMSGGVISGNSVTHSINPNKGYGTNGIYLDGAYAGGVAPWKWNVIVNFVKTGGIIYGNDVTGNDEDGYQLKNTAQNDNSGRGSGHAVYFANDLGNSNPRRNTTSYANNNMDSSKSGSAGGWE
ncbi:MAG: InlB B-repeat-containing protein, partial [Treponema sp.]|nr:InlB B-repeat-containing protein [Treponema sp.]